MCIVSWRQNGAIMQGAQGVPTQAMLFLPSKINKPYPAAKALVRQRLNDIFKQSPFCPLSTVVAPAGFGKTTAVLSWLDSVPDIPVAWFLLDSEDRSLDRFWHYFIAAIRNGDEKACYDFSEVHMDDQFETMQPVIDSLIYQLTEYGGDFICVLEDYHSIQNAKNINASLLYFIRHLPSNVHVLITSRQPVDFPIQKMRVEGLLVEVTDVDLRFTRSEIADFFKMNGIALSTEDLSELCAATKGWPTGNRLVMLLCEGDTPELVRDALDQARQSINNYFFEEVFAVLTPIQQQFLVITSAVSTFCTSLAERITGFSKTQVMETLDFLIDGGLFIEHTESKENEEWFRYHTLLADMLRNRLAHTDSAQVTAIRKTARDWFEQNGFLDYVVDISSEIHDSSKVKELILNNWLYLYMSDSLSTLLRWAEVLSDEEIQRSPALCAVLAMPVASAGDIERGNIYIHHAIENLNGGEDFLFALCMTQKAYLYSFQNDYANARLCAQQALKCLHEKEYYLRSMMLQVLASSYFLTAPLHAKAGFTQAIEMQHPLGNKNLLCSAYCNVAQICAHLGHVEEAEHYANLALDLYPAQERQCKAMLSVAYAAQMGCRYQRADYQGVLEVCRLYELSSASAVISLSKAMVMALFAKTHYALGEAAGKGEFFRAISISYPGALLSFPSLAMSKDYLAVFRTTALEQIERQSKHAFLRIFEYSLAFHSGIEKPVAEICSFADTIESEERLCYLYAHILAALYCEKAAQHNASIAYVLKALAFAKEHNISEPLRENIQYLRPLLSDFCSHEMGADSEEALFAQQLLNQQELRFSRLTERELEVMRSVAEGHTIGEVARKLFVSKETVKKHLANTYAKLGVHSKMQAAALLRHEGIM